MFKVIAGLIALAGVALATPAIAHSIYSGNSAVSVVSVIVVTIAVTGDTTSARAIAVIAMRNGSLTGVVQNRPAPPQRRLVKTICRCR